MADVPNLPNGKVDDTAVMSSFAVTSLIAADAHTNEIKGQFLEKKFSATSTQDVALDQFTLTMRAEQSTEDAMFLTAVLLIDMICLKRNRRRSEVRWQETAVKVDKGWQVVSPCSVAARLPS